MYINIIINIFKGASDVLAGIRIIARSFQNNTAEIFDRSKLYGTVENGPIPDMSVTPVNFSERAACLEFRCAGVAFDGKKLVSDLATQVDISTTRRCTFKP